MFFVYFGHKFIKNTKYFEWSGVGGGCGVTPFITALGDTNPSDATANMYNLFIVEIYKHIL